MRGTFAIAAAVMLAGMTLPATAPAQEEEHRSRPEMVFIREGSQPRIMLGISMSSDDADAPGVVVMAVTEGSPAEEAGLQAGDIITGLAGYDLTKPLDDEEDEPTREIQEEGRHEVRIFMAGPPAQRRLRAVMDKLEADEPVDITWIRDGSTSTGTIIPRVMEPSAMAFSWNGEPGSVRFRTLDELGEGGVSVFRMEEPGNAWAPHIQVVPGHEDEVRVRVSPRIQTRHGEMLRLQESLDGARSRLHEFAIHMEEGPCRAGFGLIVSDRIGCVDGVQMLQMNEGLGEYFGTSEGVLVTEAAAENTLGLESGDVLLSIGGRTVRDPGHAARILSSYEPDEEIPLRIRRQNRESEVTGTRKN